MAMGPLTCRGRTLAFVIASWLVNLAAGIDAGADWLYGSVRRPRKRTPVKTTPSPRTPPEELVRWKIPADGDSFFRAIMVSMNSEVLPDTPLGLREVVSNAYKGQADADHILVEGVEPEGDGMREARVLSATYHVQICIINITSKVASKYTTDCAVPQDGRPVIFLLHYGDHFDCILRPDHSDGVFWMSDMRSMRGVNELAMKLKAQDVKRTELVGDWRVVVHDEDAHKDWRHEQERDSGPTTRLYGMTLEEIKHKAKAADDHYLHEKHQRAAIHAAAGTGRQRAQVDEEAARE